MDYKFKCEKCKNIFYIGIPVSDYDKEKNRQHCPKCNAKASRVIEWNGIAEGSGAGWFGKSDGSNAI